MTASYLVTGAAGFVGYHVCEALLADCLQVLSPQPLAEMPDSFEGCLILLLERLSDAKRLGHPVLALIGGSAIIAPTGEVACSSPPDSCRITARTQRSGTR